MLTKLHIGTLMVTLLAVCLLALPVAGHAQSQLEQMPTNTLARIGEATVYVDVYLQGTEYGKTGSGFLISPDGYVITNAHVVDEIMLDDSGAKPVFEEYPIAGIFVTLYSGTPNAREYEAELISIGSRNDLDMALLKIDAPGALPYLSLNPAEELSLTEDIWVVGYPLGWRELAVREGTVSRLRHDADFNVMMIEHLADTDGGNSGGPVVNETGHVVGVHFGYEGRNSQLAFSSEYLVYFMELSGMPGIVQGIVESGITPPETMASAGGGTEPVGGALPMTSGGDDEEVLMGTFQPGDYVGVAWDNPVADFDLIIVDENLDYITASEGEGPFIFSADSFDSGEASEWAELDVSAPQAVYGVTVAYLGCSGATPPQDTFTVWVNLYDPAGEVIQNLGTYEFAADLGNEEFAIAVVAVLENTGDQSIIVGDWIPGDFVEILWDDPDVDFDIGFMDPAGTISMTTDNTGPFNFGEDSLVSGDSFEWGELSGNASAGEYAIFVGFAGYIGIGSPEPEYTVSINLYDANGDLKQELGSYWFSSDIEPGDVAVEYVGSLLYEGGAGTGELDYGASAAYGSWRPGDHVAIAWDDAQLDFDLFLATPTEEIRTALEPGVPFTFSQDSADSGEGVEWCQLLHGAERGEYVVGVLYSGWHGSGAPPATVTVEVGLFDEDVELLETLGSFVFDLTNPNSDDIGDIVASLTY